MTSFDATNGNDMDMESITIETGHQAVSRDVGRRAHWHRVIHTCCVCSSMLALGWSFGLLGPTFPDLLLIVDQDVATASWIFTCWSFGGLLGAVAGGVTYDRLHKVSVFLVGLVGLGVSVGAAPWCSYFPAMLLVHVLIGMFNAIVKTAATADCAIVWRSGARSALQAVHGFLCIGAIIAPVVSEPFLAQPLHMERTTVSNISTIDRTNTSITSVLANVPSQNSFYPSMSNCNTCSSNTSNRSEAIEFQYGETQISVTYFISGGVCFLSAAMFVVSMVTVGDVYSLPPPDEVNLNVRKRTYILNTKQRNVFTMVLALTIMLYIASERVFSQFLMTFLLSALGWDKKSGATASTIFWVLFAGGRMAAIPIVARLKNGIVLSVHYFIVILSSVGLYIAVIYDITALVYVTIGLAGLGMSTLFGSLVAMLAEKVRLLTGKVSMVILLCNNIGGMGLPLLLGYLIEQVTPLWFIYCIIIIYILLIISTACVYGFYKYFSVRFNENTASQSGLKD